MLKSVARLLLLFVIALTPLYWLRLDGLVPTNFVELLAIAAFLVALAAWRVNFKLPYWQPILLIVAGLVLGCLVSPDLRTSLGILKGWFIVPILFFWAVTNVLGTADVPVVMRTLWWSVLVTAAHALLQWLGLLGLLPHQAELGQYLNEGRALGWYESPNYLAMYLLPASLMLGGYYFSKRHWGSVLWLLVPLLVILAAQSDAAYVAFIAITALYGLWANRQRLGAPAASLLSVAGLAILLGVIYVLSIEQELGDRLVLWGFAGELGISSLLTGVGAGTFQDFFQQRFANDPAAQELLPYALHPHNLYLSLLLSGGVLTVIGFLWLVFKFARKLVSNPDQVFIPLLGVGAVLVHGFFDTTYFKNDLAILFWLFAGLFWIMSRQTETTNG